jgi:hypothetical protein
MKIVKRFSIALCIQEPQTLFVFGDNLVKVGNAGQAVIRYCNNAFGFPTKKLPATTNNAYFTDVEYEDNCKLFDRHVEQLKLIQSAGLYEVCFPEDGLGTGLSKLPEKAPKTFEYLCKRLLEEFNYNNGQ